MSVALAATHHDPGGLMFDQVARTLPLLGRLLGALTIRATMKTQQRTLDLLQHHGVRVRREHDEEGELKLGRSRRDAVALALEAGLPFVLFCDLDRLIHWAEHHPGELEQVISRVPEHDFTVLGRTRRAFESHPRTQVDTEAIVNQVFARVSGHAWDVTAAARGMSRRAAEAILAGCPDESIGTDCSWPLFLQRRGSFSMSYIATEGLEFETADRHPDAVAAAGGRAAWNAQIEADPRRWSFRLRIAAEEIDAMIPYLDAG